MPKIDIAAVEARTSSAYPDEFSHVTEGRAKRKLGDVVGLTQFGVNLTTLAPGAASALRHWHEQEDEFVYVVSGEVVLAEDDGETVLKAGDAAGFKAGVPNGHCLINRTDRDAVILEVGTRSLSERAQYADVDMTAHKDEAGYRFTRKSGEPYR